MSRQTVTGVGVELYGGGMEIKSAAIGAAESQATVRVTTPISSTELWPWSAILRTKGMAESGSIRCSLL